MEGRSHQLCYVSLLNSFRDFSVCLGGGGGGLKFYHGSEKQGKRALAVPGILQNYSQFFVAVFSASVESINSKWKIFLDNLALYY